MVITKSSTLNNRYTVQSVLGEVGPFDVSYLAWDTRTDREVVVKEYYPLHIAKRATDGVTLEVHDVKLFEYGLGAYTAEAHRLIDITHPNIVNCIDNFKANGTIYSVTEHLPGASSYGYMTQQGGALLDEEALTFIGPIMEGLHMCHEDNLFHGGIWPKSIHITPDGNPVLIGFSQARFQLARYCDKTSQVQLPGFTAPEQADIEVPPGYWWDVFGAAATMFYLITGYQLNYQREISTEEHIHRLIDQESTISSGLKQILEEALSFDYARRPGSIITFHEKLFNEISSKSLLSAHTNGHKQLASSYPTSISNEESSTWSITNHAAHPVETHEILDHINGKEEEKLIDTPPAEEKPHNHDTNKPMHEDPTDSPATPDLLTQDRAYQTGIVAQDQQRQHQLVEDRPPAQTSYTSTSASSDKEVAQLLTKMVRWQQKLIAFILGFVFLVVFAVLAFFAGPQLLESLSNSSLAGVTVQQSTDSPSQQDLSFAPLAAAAEEDSSQNTASIPDILTSSGGTGITELVSPDASSITGVASTSRTSSSSDDSRSNENRSSSSSDDSDEASGSPRSSSQNSSTESSSRNSSEDDDASDNGDPSDETQQSESEDTFLTLEDLTDITVASTSSDSSTVIDSLQATIDVPAVLEENSPDIDDMLREREYEMYRTIGDSLLNQGFDDAALQWYQSALTQKPQDSYIRNQIEEIALSKEQQSRTDSLELRLAMSRDQNGIFVQPDEPPVMTNKRAVHSRLSFPPACNALTQGGHVIARVVVNEDGTPSNASIVRSLHPYCDSEVIRVLNTGEFEPAMFNGETVKAWFVFSVEFER